MNAAIEFRHVSISFEDKLALDDVSFRLERGQMICVTGISGSGKSVLLRVASGLFTPDAGEVFVEGREITALDEQELLAIRSSSMGIMFQEQSLFTGMSVYDNTAYRLDEHEWGEQDTERAVREILSFVGLQEEMERLPEELSVGMGRRLEFARALVGWPKIMLFDEATAGLDPINARAMLDLVIRARDIHQISSIFVTKELHEIPYLDVRWSRSNGTANTVFRGAAAEAENDTKLLLLERGKVCFLGSVADFQSSSMPAVTRMTRPEPGAPYADSYVADPWNRKRKGIL